jgi:hypothetical protein
MSLSILIIALILLEAYNNLGCLMRNIPKLIGIKRYFIAVLNAVHSSV